MKRQLILSHSGKSVDLYNDEGIRIVSSDGLGFSAAVNTTELYSYDGSMFQGNRLQQRGISVIARYIGAKWTHEVSKKRLMSIIGNKNTVRIRYITENTDVYIDCRTEQVNTPPNTFPMVTQISFVCPDPYWRKSGDNSVIIAGTTPCWEFPVEIPSEGMEFGTIRAELITVVNNEGTAESGALFTITTKSSCTNPKLMNVYTGEFIQVAVSMQYGDILEICTEQGKKSIYFTHNGVKSDYFNYRVSGSTFFQIACGENPIKYTVDTGDSHAIDITCKFDTKYGGI